MNKTKKEVLEHIKDRYEAGAFEEGTYRLLEKLIKNAKNDDEAILIAELGVGRRTGLNYSKKMEVFTSDIKYLKRNEKLSFKDEKENSLTHKLIIGDNYPALKNLLLTYRHKVDVIYIDPPYGSDSMGNFAKTNYTNSLTRHNLLSMLYPRLVLAKQLLSDSGVIFCSFDDKNHAYLKCLFDEIFGEENFITSFVWQKKKGGGQAKYVYEGHEYVLTYARDKKQIDSLVVKEAKSISKNSLYERDGKVYYINDDIIRKVFGKYQKGTERRCHYEELLELKGQDTLNEVNAKIASGEYILTPSKTEENKHYVCRLEDISEGKYKTVYSILTGMIEGMRTETGNNLIESLNLSFSDAKPVELLQLLLNMTQNKNAIILDFFAGSGTTGQAVLELNKEDGGNRQFILCTNNEKEDGYIAETVTSKRLKRVMTGSCYDGNTDFEWIKKNEPYGDNLEVFDIAEVSANISDGGTSPFDVIDETCYDKKFDNIQDKIDWVCNNFQGLTKKLED